GEQPALLGPNKGRDQLWRILKALAQGRAGPSPGSVPNPSSSSAYRSSPDLAELLRRVRTNIARGLTVAIITPACTPHWPVELLTLKRRGVAATTILLDPASFGGSGNAMAMRSLLADLSIGCQIVQQGVPLPPVFKVKPQGRPEYRIGATGRVIRINGTGR
ncbi:MAG: hypothetical protein ACE5HA_19530, partial [Anaerolineae bacterium]